MQYTAKDLSEMLDVSAIGFSRHDGLPVASLNELVDVAMRSRADLSQTVGFYLKLELGGDYLGRSKAEILRAVQTVNQALVVCGLPSDEQKHAIAAITQTVAQGEMGNDEFRVICENLPILARAIAEEMGLSIKQLVQAQRSHGYIDAHTLLVAIDAIKNEVLQAFARTNATVTQAENCRRTMDVMREFRATGDGQK